MSKSKGRRYRKDGTYRIRKRRHWQEIELICDLITKRWKTVERFPFDEVAEEIYHRREFNRDGLEIEERLRRDVKEYASI